MLQNKTPVQCKLTSELLYVNCSTLYAFKHFTVWTIYTLQNMFKAILLSYEYAQK